MIIKTRATKTARTINWIEFNKGEIVNQRRLSLTPTIVTPDVIDNVFLKCEEIGNYYKIKILIPNGFTIASFDIMVSGKGFQITCSRRLFRGLFPLNALAPEFGQNYDAIFSIIAEERIKKQFENVLNVYKTD